jgi:uncharacterized protein YdaU (DUF1376 family)
LNFYEHHIRDYDAATAHLSWDEDMAYTRLMRWYYRKERPIPADVAEACRQVRATSKPQREAVAAVLSEFFDLRDDGWHQRTCDEVIAAYQAGEPERELKKDNEDLRLKRHRQERADLFRRLNAVGQHAPWNTPIKDLRELVNRLTGDGTATPAPAAATAPVTAPATPATATQYPLPSTQSPLPSTHSPLPSSQNGESEEPPKRPKPASAPCPPPAADAAASTRGTRLPGEWQLPKAWGEWTQAEFPHWPVETIRKVADGFKDHWTAKAGKDATKLDWMATWRNWCRGDITQRQYPPPRAASAPTLDTAQRNADVDRLLGVSHGGEFIDG